MERELGRGARLDQDRRFLTWSATAKSCVTGQVIRRRLGLLEGAAVLHAIDARRPARLRVLIPGGPPGPADEESSCRTMLEWVEGELRRSGSDAGRYAELKAELEEALRRPGSLRLPEVSLERCLPPELLPAPAPPAD